MRQKVPLKFEGLRYLRMKSQNVIIQVDATEQYFSVTLFLPEENESG